MLYAFQEIYYYFWNDVKRFNEIEGENWYDFLKMRVEMLGCDCWLLKIRDISRSSSSTGD